MALKDVGMSEIQEQLFKKYKRIGWRMYYQLGSDIYLCKYPPFTKKNEPNQRGCIPYRMRHKDPEVMRITVNGQVILE
jgi:hypothetical protein